MRDFFINSFEKLVVVIIGLMSLGVVIGALGTLFSGQPGGFIGAIAILIFGAVYIIMLGGVLYLFLGIHDNTRRTAEAVEKMAGGQ